MGITKIKIHKEDELYTHFQFKRYTKSPQTQVRSNDMYTSSWNNPARSRNLTEQTNLIIIHYVLASPNTRVLGSRLIKALLVSSLEFQGDSTLPSRSYFRRVLFSSSDLQRVLLSSLDLQGV
jgi:hypothetical protein